MTKRLTERQYDERLLDMLQWQDEGFTSFQIARHMGLNAASVRGMIGRIRREMR